MSDIDTPTRYAVAEEIMVAITASPTPLCAQQLLPLCENAESSERIAKTLYSLKKSGRLVEDDPVLTNSGPRKSYRLPTEAEKLMAHLETELDASEQILAAEDPTDPEACLDQSCHSSNGDEMHRCKGPAPVHQVSDPLLAAIERLSEPHWLGGQQDAERLRALARCAPIACSVDVASYLDELADRFEAMSR